MLVQLVMNKCGWWAGGAIVNRLVWAQGRARRTRNKQDEAINSIPVRWGENNGYTLKNLHRASATEESATAQLKPHMATYFLAHTYFANTGKHANS